MKIAYNPITAAALTTAPANNDITFDLKGLNIFVRGVKFKGTDTTYSVFKKHTSSSGGGYNGLVPVPSYTSTNTRFLREDGTWQVPSNQYTYSALNGTDLDTLKTEGKWYYIARGSTNTNGPEDFNKGSELYIGRNASGYKYLKVITASGLIWFRIWNGASWSEWKRWYTDANTDSKVLQSNTTTGNFRPIILGYNNNTDHNNISTSITNLVYTTTSIYAQPSTGYLWATKLYSGGKEVLTSHLSLSNYVTINGNLTITGQKIFDNDTTIIRNYLSNSETNQVSSIPSAVLSVLNGYPIYSDPTFKSGNNSCSTYNNSSGGNVTLTRISDTQNSANGSGFILEIKNTGTASPGIGGYYLTITSRANAVFAQVIYAKIPIGYYIRDAQNSMGTGSSFTWLTTKDGTGKWAWYVRLTYCGNSEPFSNGGHVYLDGNSGTSSNPVIWYVAFSLVYDITKGSVNLNKDNFKNWVTPSSIGAAALSHTHTISDITNFAHNHPTSQITSLSGYSKATSNLTVTTTDTLNIALGKLAYKGDLGVAAYNLVNAAYDGDGTIENLKEILKVLEGISDTDTIKELLGKYLPLTGGTLTGNLTFSKGNIYFNTTSYLHWSNGTYLLKIAITDDGSTGTSVFNFLQSTNSGSSWSTLASIYDNGVIHANGFYKNGSSNQLVLLGDGSVKNLSDFSLSGHTHSYLPLSGGTMNSGSQIKRVGNSSSWVNGRDLALIRSTSYSGYNPLASMKTTNGSWDLGVYGDNTLYFSYITDANHDSETNTQTVFVRFNSNGTIYSSNGFMKAGSSDSYVLLGGGGHKTLSSLGSSHTHAYLPLSGGTMNTGAIIRVSNTGGIIQNLNDTSNYTKAIQWYKNSESLASQNPQIGCHNTGGDGTGSITILPYATETDPWNGTVGLYISKNQLKLDGKKVWFEGNDGSGSGLDADMLDGMQSTKFMYFNNLTNYVATRFVDLNLADIAATKYIEWWQSDAGWFNFRAGKYYSVSGFIKEGSSNSLVLLGGGGVKNLSDFATSNHTHNYLPLTGGTLTNQSLGGQLSIYRNANAYSVIGYYNNSSSGSKLLLGYIGFNTTGTAVFRTAGGVDYKLWHSGDDGNGSGLDADLLDGKHASEFMLKSEEIINNITTITKTLNVTALWMDTGIIGNDLSTGTYILLLYVNDSSLFYNTYHSGILSWYESNTNDSETDEIILHRAGHAYNKTIYLRTIQTSSGNGGMKLLIASSSDTKKDIEYKFKFKRII